MFHLPSAELDASLRRLFSPANFSAMPLEVLGMKALNHGVITKSDQMTASIQNQIVKPPARDLLSAPASKVPISINNESEPVVLCDDDMDDHFVTVPAQVPYDRSNFPWSDKFAETSRLVFGLKQFRPQQQAIMNAIMQRHDVLVLMPTGGGKSLCYQLPSIANNHPGVTIVFSPLLSLINDQVQSLRGYNIDAFAITGSTSSDELRDIRLRIEAEPPQIRLLYVTPERLQVSTQFNSWLENLNRRSRLHMFVIDEAHCVSQWGHDWRPDYAKIGIVRDRFADVPIMALTATASNQVQEEILRLLSMRPRSEVETDSGRFTFVFKQSFNRPNIDYQVVKKRKDVSRQIVEIIRQNGWESAPGIIYCLSRRDCEDTAQSLCDAGLKAAFYHGQMKPEDKNLRQAQWQDERVKIMVATSNTLSCSILSASFVNCSRFWNGNQQT